MNLITQKKLQCFFTITYQAKQSGILKQNIHILPDNNALQKK